MSKLLKSLYKFSDENFDGMLVYFKDFIDLLKRNHKTEDKLKEIRDANIERELKGQIIKLDHGTAIPFLSILKYVFKHTDNLNFCSNIAQEIEQSVLKSQNAKCARNLYDLYKTIATTTFLCPYLDVYKTEAEFKILESSIRTLHLDYKIYFSTAEWDRICLFENHFSNTCTISDQFEESVKQRWSAFEHLSNVKSISERLRTVSQRIIKSRNLRFEAHHQDTSVEICGLLRHRPTVIERKLTELVNSLHTGLCTLLAAVDLGVNLSSCNNVIDIHIQVTSENPDCLKDVGAYIAEYLKKSHFLSCSNVFLFKSGTLDTYRRNDSTIARFSCRDDLLCGKLKDAIIAVFKMPNIQDFELDSNNEICTVCFDESLPQPLSASEFYITKEWCLDVPLDIQLLFESFINRDTFCKANDKSIFLKKKLERLYSTYDVLLNTTNKNFIGILQQANTDELVMNYHSVNTVFAVTSSSGTTSSLASAEKRLKDRAVDDVCYFNTYLKKYPLSYETDAGIVDGLVSLRDCHLILMLDNLVRLKYHSDPNPGESRSGQLCTLPLTIQGVPKDWKGTENWHDPNICNGTSTCDCKKRVQLKQTDIRPSLIDLSEAEQGAWDRFVLLNIWGIPELLTDLSGELAEHFPEWWITSIRKEQHQENSTELHNGIHADSKKSESCNSEKMISEFDGSEKVSENDMSGDEGDKLLDIDYEIDETHENTVAWEGVEKSIEERRNLFLDNDDDDDDDDDDDGKGLHTDYHDDNDDDDDDDDNDDDNEDDGAGLYNLLISAEEKLDLSVMDEDLIFDELDTSLPMLEKSMESMQITDNDQYKTASQLNNPASATISEEPIPDTSRKDEEKSKPRCPHLFGFSKFIPPPLLCRHPPPAVGRDDDINKLREILDDVLDRKSYLCRK